ncbi:DUF1778 domain-containing protein [Roseomonas frigidaquae]|uniref:DUF1778 domain-containing protein n=1 Tax=Falsiroseomonas frigidaquae TaxID=487318 RepID=A0ABX1ERW3_9PROT|nr:DUF1778 domain-containing protein [Falsiroseomonas frigidaquae]NKE43366.1 DUF1778 domain-containing protein [Falsiroseomonas frigidaquae]
MTALRRERDDDNEGSQEVKINLRARKEDSELIDRAAKMQGKTRTAFMLESARKAAVDTLLDQRQFFVVEERWKAFTAALDAPPEDNPALKRLLQKRAPWEK